MSEPGGPLDRDGWERVSSRTRSALREAGDRVAVAQDAARGMENLTSQALWALSRVVLVQERGQERSREAELRAPLHQLAEACQDAVLIGRQIHRLLGEAVEEIRTATATMAAVRPDLAGQDLVHHVTLGARLAVLEEGLVRCRPVLEQAVVRLTSAAEHAHQSVPASEGTVPRFPVEAVDRRLSVALEVGETLRRDLAAAQADSGRARGRVDTLCRAATARMAAHHARAPFPDQTATAPGVGR
ncbi:hypothetical protein [Ornithinimicrobium avium]|uniref:Uncharacterized protein n=1 Tax=Ornithinimicrobium avium TaxID=2283195 RepID=A0A345NLR0_9MICO|nr:hypothetical protein [Ornithinimicrobium avium]AXH95968.1 hypothetical protein DV701_07380 [Ornithinimicrobium avium]